MKKIPAIDAESWSRFFENKTKSIPTWFRKQNIRPETDLNRQPKSLRIAQNNFQCDFGKKIFSWIQPGIFVQNLWESAGNISTKILKKNDNHPKSAKNRFPECLRINRNYFRTEKKSQKSARNCCLKCLFLEIRDLEKEKKMVTKID